MFKHFGNCYIICTRSLKNKFSPDVQNKKIPKYLVDFYAIPPHLTLNRAIDFIDDNTRIITVEGLPCSKKSTLCEKLADYFRFHYVDDVTDKQLFEMPVGQMKLDMREYDSIMPEHAKMYTKERLFNDPDPINKGKPLFLQKYMYLWRYWNSCKSLSHIFNTGQGVVQKKSAFSDKMFVLALKDHGKISDIAYKYYNAIRGESITTLWKPHFIVYLKSPIEQIRENMQKDKRWEASAKYLTDDFLNTYQRYMLEQYLPTMSRFSKVYIVDTSLINVDDEADFHYVAENIAALNVRYKDIQDYSQMFEEWRMGCKGHGQMYINRRFWSYAYKTYTNSIRTLRVPESVPEGSIGNAEVDIYQEILKYDPRIVTDIDTNIKYNSWFQVLFPKKSRNYYDPAHMPSLKFMDEIIRDMPAMYPRDYMR